MAPKGAFMRRFTAVVAGAALALVATSVLADGGSPVFRRTTRLDLLSRHVQQQPTASSAAPGLVDHQVSTLPGSSEDPNLIVAIPEVDVLGYTMTTRGGLHLEAVEVNLEVKLLDARPAIVLDRVALDTNEIGELLSTKQIARRPIVDRPIAAEN
jgi:hypothetical protein